MPAEEKQRGAPRKTQRAAPYAKTHVCHRCAAAFVSPSKLATHIRTVHEKRRDHGCPQCDSAFGEAGTLATHIRAVHEKRRDYACPHCDAAFARASTRARHMHTQHPNDNAHAAECPICLDTLAGVADTATTPCDHLFCRPCIETALALRSECPSCMQACTAEDLQ